MCHYSFRQISGNTFDTPDTNTDKDQRLLVGAESAEWFKAHKVKAVSHGAPSLHITVLRQSHCCQTA